MKLSWRVMRQLMGILIVLGVIVALGFWVYVSKFKVEPTCFDGKQNGIETGIDCGGGCRLVCADEARPLVVRWQRPFQTIGEVYNAVAYLENPNPTLGIRQLNYEVKIYDEENVLIVGPITQSVVVGPNQNTALFVGPLQTSLNRTPARAFFTLTGTSGFEYVDPFFAGNPLVVQSQSFERAPVGSRLSATIANPTQRTIADIEFVALLYDTDANVVGVAKTTLERMLPYATQDITFTWPSTFEDGQVVRAVITPQINVFHPENDRL